MKNFLITFIILLLTSVALAHEDSIVIINQDTPHRMRITYRICTINTAFTEPACEKDQETLLYTSLKIPVDNWVYDVHITKVLELNEHDEAIAMKEFPGEEDCKGFTHQTIFLSRNKDSIVCKR